MIVQNRQSSTTDLQKAQQETLSAYRLAVENDLKELAARCCFYVAYTHLPMLHLSASHRAIAVDYLTRAQEASRFGWVEGEMAANMLIHVQSITPNKANDSRPSTSDSTVANIMAMTRLPAWNSDSRSEHRSSIASNANSHRPTTADSMDSATIRDIFGSPPAPRPSTRTHQDIVEADPQCSPSSADDTLMDDPDNNSRKLCRAEKPSGSFLATLKALQSQENAQPPPTDAVTSVSSGEDTLMDDPGSDVSKRCQAEKPSGSFLATLKALQRQENPQLSPTDAVASVSSGDDTLIADPDNNVRKLCRAETPSGSFLATLKALNGQEEAQATAGQAETTTSPEGDDSDLSAMRKRKSSSPERVGFTPSAGNLHRLQEEANPRTMHRRSLSQSLSLGLKQRSDIAQMEEGESPVRSDFAQSQR